MPSITIRNVPEVVHRRLRVRAAKNGRSMEAELRVVLSIAAGLSRRKEEQKPAAARPEPLALSRNDALAGESAIDRVREMLKERAEEDAA